MFTLAPSDSRIWFEATNRYFRLAIDLMDKVVNCDAIARQSSL